MSDLFYVIHVKPWRCRLALKSTCRSITVAIASQLDDYALIEDEGKQSLREQEIVEAFPSSPELPEGLECASQSCNAAELARVVDDRG